tara:strand:- start:3549 stop:3776 length:228 start_codon:yes stop_codon:yes gene_type:complete
MIMNNDKLDITNIQAVEDQVLDMLSGRLLNGLVLPMQLEILERACRIEAQRIIKDAEGDVKKDLDKYREAIMSKV